MIIIFKKICRFFFSISTFQIDFVYNLSYPVLYRKVIYTIKDDTLSPSKITNVNKDDTLSPSKITNVNKDQHYCSTWL